MGSIPHNDEETPLVMGRTKNLHISKRELEEMVDPEQEEYQSLLKEFNIKIDNRDERNKKIKSKKRREV
ncbi:MAG: hypothetical protein WC961_07170 [Anaerovoracaceae bacterium]|jgi:hypothetical protein